MARHSDRLPGCIELEEPEAVFRIDGVRDLSPPGGDRLLLTYFTRRIAAEPHDLLSHVRRVLLGRALSEREEVFAALVDLFIATGAKGQAIKRRLLVACSPLLTPLQRQFLEKHRPNGLDAGASVASDLAVLTSGASDAPAFAAGIRRSAFDREVP